MVADDFRDLCDNVILKYIDEIKQLDSFNCLRVNKHKIKKIFIYYERKRTEVKRVCMKNKNQLLDRHKIASSFIYAILKAKVFTINRLIPNLPEKIQLANEYLAFYVALNIIEMFKRSEGYEDYLLIFPDTYHNEEYEDDIFILNTCKGLGGILNLRYFDTIAYATILFQMERFTDFVLGWEPLLNIETLNHTG